MITGSQRAVSAALVVLSGMACGSTTHDTPRGTAGAAGSAGSGGASTLEETQAFAAAAATAACKVLFSCSCNLVATSMCSSSYCPTTQIECEPALLGHFSPSAWSIFHPDQAQACLDALAGQGCDIPTACTRVYEPSAEPGAPCGTNSDCVARPGETAYCSFSTLSCVAYARGVNGQACDTSCAGGQYASCTSESETGGVGCWFEDGLRCLDGVCAPLGTTGDPCTTDLLTGCDWYNLCAAGQCTLNGAPLGAACTAATTLCAGQTYCGADATCQLREPGGAPCTQSSECAHLCHDGQCTGTAPDATGVCTWF
jgi:hypothetical protein